jgi:hypothetical protein
MLRVAHDFLDELSIVDNIPDRSLRVAAALAIVDRNCDRSSEVNHCHARPPNPGLNVSGIRLA